jgi:heme oxygenase
MPSLPEALRAATRELHGRAERAGVMGELLRGRLARERYVALLRNLHGLYVALEARELPVASLKRAQALADDLTALHGAGWAQAHGICRAADEYIARLATADAPALAAHTYVRYLGDVHGGQILAPLVRRLYGLRERAGTLFYDFGSEAAVAHKRACLRSELAALKYAEHEVNHARSEARWAFNQHIRMFEELLTPPRP